MPPRKRKRRLVLLRLLLRPFLCCLAEFLRLPFPPLIVRERKRICFFIGWSILG